MYSFECAGSTFEVEGYQFLAGYSRDGWIHSSAGPHVWARQEHCKVIEVATLKSRTTALRQVLESATTGHLLPRWVLDRVSALIPA